MKASIECCDFFDKIKHNFEWFRYQGDNEKRVLCMPYLTGYDDYKIRINHCPNCGKEIRNIELTDD